MSLLAHTFFRWLDVRLVTSIALVPAETWVPFAYYALAPLLTTLDDKGENDDDDDSWLRWTTHLDETDANVPFAKRPDSAFAVDVVVATPPP